MTDNPTVTRSEILAQDQSLTPRHLTGLLEGLLLGVSVPGVLPESACETAATVIRAATASERYAGNLATGLGAATWPVRFEGGDTPEAWFDYFGKIEEADRIRKALFKPILGFDPLDQIMGILQAGWSKRVIRAVHPRYGRLLNGCVVRGGVADPHYDDAGLHAGLNCEGHIGIVLVLDSMAGAYQRVWPIRVQGPSATGHYPQEEPSSVPYVDIPTPIGSVAFLSARYLHKVVDDERRLTVAAHASLSPSGDLEVYA